MTDAPIKTIEDLTMPETGWWITKDEESYSGGPLDTREEALLAAMEADAHGIAYLTRKPVRVSDLFDAESFIEVAEEVNADDWHDENGDPVLDFTEDEVADLQAAVCAAIDDWQVRHQLAPMPWLCVSVDDAESLAETATDDRPAVVH